MGCGSDGCIDAEVEVSSVLLGRLRRKKWGVDDGGAYLCVGDAACGRFEERTWEVQRMGRFWRGLLDDYLYWTGQVLYIKWINPK